MMTANEIRRKFLDYFTGKGHRLVPSDSLIPSNDPSILFTVAGMVQFKPLYVAKEKPYTRATSCQKSIRTNDIEVVGTDERHLTFFEMLGNFSFGDYFKKEAIGFGWEFLVDVLKVDPGRLYVTVFEKDDEAFDLWASRVPALKEKGRIIRFGDEDNYWPAGSVLPTWVGPNGPCSEIHYDFGEDKCPFPKKCRLPGEHECDRFKEVWNLVFPQFMRTGDGQNPPMEKPGIDTGMGFERLVAVVQGRDSIFETDLFKPYFERLDGLFVNREAADGEALIQAKRIVSDHSRSAVFLVSDGVVPSNEGRGYVLRRLIRRATRQESLFGDKDRHVPIVAEMVPIVVKVMGEQYPELKERQADIQRIIRDEEERFLETVQRGLSEIQDLRRQADPKTGKPRSLTGNDAFQLYDTHGMPRELTLDIWLRELKGEKLSLSPGFEKEYEDAMNAQQERARAAWKGAGGKAMTEAHHALARELGATPFLGYEHLEVDVRVAAILREGARTGRISAGAVAEVVLDRTPFYAESGGQVADLGKFVFPGGEAEVTDVQKPVSGMVVHTVRMKSGALAEGSIVRASVDGTRRAAIARHHTATHLLHGALHQLVGKGVTQAGSLVTPDRLRFDFLHPKAVEPGRLKEIEELVNAKVMENVAVATWETTPDDARKRGAMALFGEKYGDRVRVLEVGDFSRELCGGTHVKSTGEIGPFVITAEGAVAAGVRRIEAVAGGAALKELFGKREAVEKSAYMLKVPPEAVEERLARTLESQRALETEVRDLKSKLAQKDLAAKATGEVIGGVKVTIAEVEAADPAALRELADRALDRLGDGLVLLGARGEGKCHLIGRAGPETAKKVGASDVVKAAAAAVGGTGGGKATMAQAGGKDPAKLPEAFAKAREFLGTRLKGG